MDGIIQCYVGPCCWHRLSGDFKLPTFGRPLRALEKYVPFLSSFVREDVDPQHPRHEATIRSLFTISLPPPPPVLSSSFSFLVCCFLFVKRQLTFTIIMIVRRDFPNITPTICWYKLWWFTQDSMQICDEDQGVHKKNLCVKQCARKQKYEEEVRIAADRCEGTN